MLGTARRRQMPTVFQIVRRLHQLTIINFRLWWNRRYFFCKVKQGELLQLCQCSFFLPRCQLAKTRLNLSCPKILTIISCST
jgi:hypothetical protein